MTKSPLGTDKAVRALNENEIEAVAGGMKSTRGVSNPDVKDARGGSLTFFGIRFNLGLNGKVTVG